MVFVLSINEEKNTRYPLTIPRELKLQLEALAKEKNVSLNRFIIDVLSGKTKVDRFVRALRFIPIQRGDRFKSQYSK